MRKKIGTFVRNDARAFGNVWDEVVQNSILGVYIKTSGCLLSLSPELWNLFTVNPKKGI
jgi:hypothetical protein